MTHVSMDMSVTATGGRACLRRRPRGSQPLTRPEPLARMRREALRLSLPAALVLVHRLLAPEPAAVPAVDLTWRAPAGCPDAAVVTSMVAGLVRGPTEPEPDLPVARATVTRHGSGWQVRLDLQASRGRYRRVMRADDCLVLARAAALLIAIHLDPLAVTRSLESAAPLGPPRSPPPGSPRTDLSEQPSPRAADLSAGTVLSSNPADLSARTAPSSGPADLSPRTAPSSSPADLSLRTAPSSGSADPAVRTAPSTSPTDLSARTAPSSTSPADLSAGTASVPASPGVPVARPSTPETPSPRTASPPALRPAPADLSQGTASTPAVPPAPTSPTFGDDLSEPPAAVDLSEQPASPAPPRRLAGHVRLDGGLDYGVLPRVGGHAGLFAGLSLARVRLEAGLVGVPLRLVGADEAAAPARFDRLTAALRVCPTFQVHRVVILAVCLAGEVGAIRGVARVADPRPQWAPWAGLTLGPALRVRVAGPLGIYVGLEGLLALARPTFTVRNDDDVFRAGRAGARATFGLELQFAGRNR